MARNFVTVRGTPVFRVTALGFEAFDTAVPLRRAVFSIEGWKGIKAMS
jgi:hypothetical protein